MSKPRRPVSAGTVLMLFLTAAVLVGTLAAFIFIRGSRENLAMDAGRLVSSIGDMIAARASLTPSVSVQATVVVVTPASVTATAPDAPTPTPAGQPDTVQTATATVVPEVTNAPVKRSLSLTFGGLLAFESNIVDACVAEGVEKPFTAVLAGVSDAVHADLNIALLPTLLHADSAQWCDGVAPAQCLEAIFHTGFDYLILGSENSLERGEAGVAQTLAAIAGSGISASGLYAADETDQTAYVMVNGVRIAILTYNEALSKASIQAVPDEALRSRLITPFMLEKAISDVKAADNAADIVLVALHWGDKDATSPTKSQREAAQALCEAGADIIIGGHSDAVQPVELLSAADGRKTLVAWSLGTLLSEDRQTRQVVSGALVHLQLTYNVSGGTLSFDSVQYTPTYAWRHEIAGGNIYRLLRSSAPAPEGMVKDQRDIMGRALKLVQGVMNKGVAVER